MKICLIFVVFLYRYDLTKEPVRCCGSSNCVSVTERVAKLLDPDVLEIQIGLRYRDRENNSEKKPENYRFVAYRNLFILTYGRTRAKEERKPLPSCLVMRVRNLFPDPNNEYTGFKSKKKRKKWFLIFFYFFRTTMADEEFSDEFSEMSSPIGCGLQRGDSNRSWHPPMSQGSTNSADGTHPIDKDRLFLVSLGALMTLFR